MKRFFAAAALVAAVAALVIRPPQARPTPVEPPARVSAYAQRRPLPRPSPGVVVYVAGDVNRPGVYALDAAARAVDALARAGGAKPDADLVAVNLAAPLRDGDEIAVPKAGASAPVARGRGRRPGPHRSAAPRRRRRQPAAAPDTMVPVDLNAASEADLERLPGVGAALAARIVAFRALNGPFATLDELADVSGITPRLMDAIGAYAVVR